MSGVHKLIFEINGFQLCQHGVLVGNSHSKSRTALALMTMKWRSSRTLQQRGCSKASSLLWTSEEGFCLFKDLLDRVPCDKALRGRGAWESCLIFKANSSSSSIFRRKIPWGLHGWARSTWTNSNNKKDAYRG